MDEDGDLDLLFGAFDGTLNLRINEGTRRAPAFAASNTVVRGGGEPVKIPEGHCTPVVADWDGDWRAGHPLRRGHRGRSTVCKRRQVAGHPEFAAAVELPPRHRGLGYSEFLDTAEEPRPGIRSQIDMVDYDGDGKLDLLVGVFRHLPLRPRHDLSPAERREVAPAPLPARSASSRSSRNGTGRCRKR